MKNISKLTTTDIEKRGLLTHEPRWMRIQRIQAWENYLSMSEPLWKKQKIPKLNLAQSAKLNFPDGKIESLPMEKKPPQGTSGKITLQDDKILRISLNPELAYQGVILCDMQTAILERADLLEAYLKESSWGVNDKLSNFHKALWSNGYFLYVPKGVVLEQPIQAQIIQSNPEQSIMNRNLILIEEAASASVEEYYESTGTAKETILCCSTTEVFADEASQLSYYSNQNWAEHVYDLSQRRLNADKNAKITALFTLLGGKFGRVVVTGDAPQTGASIEHDAIIVGTKKQQYKIIAKMEHRAQNTEGMMKYKGILKDQAYTDLDGLITVRPGAQKSQSRLEEHTLLLNEKARCDALPGLDIQTEDVQVSHSAAVTQADKEKIFYLMSRGLSDQEARALIIEGFFENLLASIRRPQWYEQTKELITNKLLQSS